MVEYSQYPQYRFDFLKYRLFVALFTVGFVVAFIGIYVYRSESSVGEAFSYSVDFTGGTQVLFKFQKPVSGSQVREVS